MTAAESLQVLREALGQHARSPDLPRLLRHWRDDAALAPLAVLPPAYDQVRRALLQRLDMAAAFGEESCSFFARHAACRAAVVARQGRGGARPDVIDARPGT